MHRSSSVRAFERPAEFPTLEASLNYVGKQTSRQVFHTSNAARSELSLDPHIVTIRDARSLNSPSLFREGFALLPQKLPPLNLRDIAVRDGRYLVELQEFVRTSLNAAKVISNTSVLRLPDPNANQVAVLLVHCDFTPRSARRLLGECWDQRLSMEAGLADTQNVIAQSVEGRDSERRYSRVIAFNAWRPITEPPHDVPLAVCTTGSLADADIEVADFIEEVEGSESYRDELSLCHYSPKHEWYSFSDMTPDEVLLFIGYDYANPTRCGAMHTAFRDPGCPPGAPGRASIEVRMFAFFE